MKNLTSKLSALIALLSLAFVACDKTPVDDIKPVKFEITSSTSVEVAAQGAQLVIEYTIENPKSGASVMATAEVEWITQSDATYAEDGKILLTVEPNDAYESREATVVVRYDTFVKSVAVKQLPADRPSPDAPTVTLEGVPVQVSADGGSCEVKYSVTNPVEGLLPVPTTEAQWVTNLKAEGGFIRFDVAATDSFDIRSATIVVSYEGAAEVSFKVIQEARIQPELILNNDTLDVAASGGEYSISYVLINAIEGEELTLTLDKSWVTAKQSAYTLDLTVEPNESPEVREAVLKVEYPGIEASEIRISQAAKQATTDTIAIEIDSVLMSVDYGGEFELHFTSKEGKVYIFDIFADLSGGYIPNGIYTMADGTLSSRYCVHESGTLNGKMLNASLDAITSNGQTRFDIAWTYNDTIYTILWTGVVIGFDYNKSSGDGTVTHVEVLRANVYYDKVGEKEIIFWYDEYAGHKFNFKHSDIMAGKPVPDGVYSTEDGTMSSNHCEHAYNDEFGDITSAKVTVANDFDNKTASFDIEWEYKGAKYAISYSGAVVGYNYEDVAGTKLDFTPIKVELVDAGFSGLYFYFYDAEANELVLNYDRNKVYMPYINYDGVTLDINNEEYTFEYSDNDNGTYTYNVYFITLDGRIIEFAGALPTSVSK